MSTDTGRRLAIAGLTALGQYLCAWLGYAYTLHASGITISWPANGFMLALLLLVPPRDWKLLLAGGFIGNIAGNLTTAMSVPAALADSAANSLEVWVAAWVVVRLVGHPITLSTLKEVAAFVLGAVILSNAVTAFPGALALTARSYESFWTAWFVWWAGDGLGMLLVAPPIITWQALAAARKRVRWSIVLEGVIVCALLAAAAHVMQDESLGGSTLQNPYMALPLLFWAAIRVGPAGASTITFVLAAITAWNAARGIGPFAQAGQSAAENVLQIYAYLTLASLSSLVAASAVQELSDLEASRARLADILEAAPDLVTIGQIEGPPLYLNRAARQAFDVRDGERVDSLLAFRPPEFPEYLHRVILPALLRDGVWRGETEYVSRSGRRIPVSQVTVTHKNADGQVAFLSTISRDITEQRAVEEQLRHAQKMEAVGQLAGGVAHDFNNALTAILGYADLLASEPLPPEEQRLAVDAIRTAGTHAANLTKQLLAFGRRQMLQPKLTRLSQVLDGLMPVLRRLMGDRITIRAEADADPAILADVTQIEQIVVNLAVNAADAMPEGGELTLASYSVNVDEPFATVHPDITPGPYACLEVHDTGIGMDAATRSRIFEPFFTTKAMGRGTGLGLATVYGIVRQMHGTIDVESEPGRGATFRIYLPAQVSAHTYTVL